MLRRFGAALSLRVGLVAALLLLAACGLTASGIAVTEILRHSLIKRVAQTLEEASRGWAQAPRALLPVRRGPTLDHPPSNFYVRYITVDGRTTTVVNDSNAEPVLPTSNDVGREPITVGSGDKSRVPWRGVARRGPAGEWGAGAYSWSGG